MKNVFKLRKRKKIDKYKLSKDLYYYVRNSAPRYTLSLSGTIWEVVSTTKSRKVSIDDIPPTSKILKMLPLSLIRIDLDDVHPNTRLEMIKINHGRVHLMEMETRRVKARYTVDELREELGL